MKRITAHLTLNAVGVSAPKFAGKIELARPEIKIGGMFSSTTALAHPDELLGTGKWDLILFNASIGDLIHRAPGMESFRITADIPPRAPQWETFGSNKVLIHEPIVDFIKSQLSLR